MSARRCSQVGGLHNGCQVDVHMSPSERNQKVTRAPDVYPGIDTGLKSLKKFKFPGC